MHFKQFSMFFILIILFSNGVLALDCSADPGQTIRRGCDNGCEECHCYTDAIKVNLTSSDTICLAWPNEPGMQWYTLSDLHPYENCEVNILPPTIKGCKCGSYACNNGGANQYCCDTNNDGIGDICSKEPCNRENIYVQEDIFTLGKGFCENVIEIKALNGDWKAVLIINGEQKIINFDSENTVASQGSLVYLNIDSVNYPIRIKNPSRFITLTDTSGLPCYNKCKVNGDCDDSNICTEDKCINSPKICQNNITEGSIDGTRYCSSRGELEIKKEDNSMCTNNFECLTNICKNELCKNPNFFKNILNWFKRVF